MFSTERHLEIIKLLHSDGKVSVGQLSALFSVTEDCIRKDLNKLEQEGRLQRTHGGAVLPRQRADISILPRRRQENLAAKEQIAKKALGLLEDGDSIFLDISTTNILLAQMIADSMLNLRVMTNMMDIAYTLKDNPNLEVYCTGGLFSRNIDGFVGSEVSQMIEKYKFDKVFIGTCGIDLQTGRVTTLELEEGHTKRAILKAGRKAYLVMENRKFSFDGFYAYASTDELSAIITDGRPSEEICKLMNEKGIQLI